jgi:MFS family permease
MQGRANAALSAVTGAAQMASIAAGAGLISVFGYRSMYLVMACTALACAVVASLGRVSRPEIIKSVADDDEADATGATEESAEPELSDAVARIAEQNLVIPASAIAAPEISR